MSARKHPTATAHETIGQRPFVFQPLYRQVKAALVQRLIDGNWQPGQLIASESELAREIGVSQGTVRKALDAMTVDNLLVRKQGRGTFVAAPEESRMLFQFFRLFPNSGERSFPQSTIVRRSRAIAVALERAALLLKPGSEVWRIERIRTLQGKPLLVETISLSAARFKGLDELADIPNNVYRLYSERWNITIGAASEKLTAVGASAADARRLGCGVATPLLKIIRVASDLEKNPVELRVSRCLTKRAHYLSDLR